MIMASPVIYQRGHDHDLDTSDLEQFAQLTCLHADDREDVTEGSFGHIAAWMNRDRHGAAIGMPHDMMAAADPDDLEAGSL
jgi:hypothetical protein